MGTMRYQPQVGPFRLDPSKTSAGTQAFVAASGLSKFYLSRSNPNYTGKRVRPTVSGLGLALYADQGGPADDALQAPLKINSGVSGKLTSVLAFVPKLYGSSAPQVWLPGAYSSATVDTMGHSVRVDETTGQIDVGWDGSNGFQFIGSYTPTVSPFGRPVVIVVSTDPATQAYSFSVDGKTVTGTVGSQSYVGIGSTAATGRPTIGNGTYDEYYNPNGDVLLWATIPDRFYPQALANAVSANPWQLFLDSPDEEFAQAATGPSGTLSVSEGIDTLTSVGSVSISGTLSVSEGIDTGAAAGNVTVLGSGAVSEGVDTATGSGSASNGSSGSLLVSEGVDTLAAAGSVAITGTASMSELPDTARGFSSNIVPLFIPFIQTNRPAKGQTRFKTSLKDTAAVKVNGVVKTVVSQDDFTVDIAQVQDTDTVDIYFNVIIPKESL